MTCKIVSAYNYMNWFNMRDFQSFHKDSLMHFEAASVFCIHQIGKGPNRKNLGKVLVVLKSTIGACYNLIHYDIENIHMIVLVSMHPSPYCQCHPFHRNVISFFEYILFVALDSRLSSTAISVSKQTRLLLAFFANCMWQYSGQLENLCW
jgi:hypothetical protein